MTHVGRARRKELGDDRSKAGPRRPWKGLGTLSPVTRESTDRQAGRALISVLKASRSKPGTHRFQGTEVETGVGDSVAGVTAQARTVATEADGGDEKQPGRGRCPRRSP